MTPSSFCRAKVCSRCASQPRSNLPLVLGDPVLRHVVRCVGRARREVHEEGLVGRQALLLAHVVDRLVGEVGHQVVVGVGRRLDRGEPSMSAGVYWFVSPPMKP